MANRQSWNVEILESGNQYNADGSIYRTNEPLEIQLQSTQSKINLADGSQAFVAPEEKFIRQILIFTWLEIPETDAFRSKLENYVQNQDYIRITTHLGEQLTGRFISVNRVWLTGVVDTYDLRATFDRIE